MALIGDREDWEAFIRSDLLVLKPDHKDCIEFALSAASADAQTVEVDAVKVARWQAAGNMSMTEGIPLEEMTANIADADERWWLRRAQQLGLNSIRSIDPWPRRP